MRASARSAPATDGTRIAILPCFAAGARLRSAALCRLLLPLRREARIEALALLRHFDELLVRLEALAVFLRELLAERDELLYAHHVDVAQRAARVGRIAEPEDRADIGLAHVGEHAFLETARRFERLDREQAVLQLVRIDGVGG